MNTKKWTMANGKKIRIKDMTNSHLVNTINFLKRSATMYEDTGCPCDGDKDWCFCHATQTVRPEDLTPLYPELVAEGRRRGLQALFMDEYELDLEDYILNPDLEDTEQRINGWEN